MKVVTAAEMRALEAAAEELGMPGPALMEVAGRAVADAILDEFAPLDGRRVAVLVGPGNNGGDGLVAARWLAHAGARVVVLSVDRRGLGDDPRAALVAEAGATVHDVTAASQTAFAAVLAGSALVVDALLGIGRRRPIAGAMMAALAAAATSGAPLVALDLPSGLDPDTGAANLATPRCATTIALGAVKRGLLLADGPNRAGRVRAVEIGIPNRCANDLPVDWLTSEVVRPLLPPRAATGHKGTFGRVLIVAGSARYVGAPLLSALGAARSGAGVVTLAAPGRSSLASAARLPEITHLPLPGPEDHLGPEALAPLAEAAGGFKALVIGPGLGRERATAALLSAALADDRLRGARWVLDADALTLLAAEPGWPALLPPAAVLTPHPGEMARLLGGEQAPPDRMAVALQSAAAWGATLVLKGAHTVVAAPDGRAGVATAANPALATGGTGDVLAGAIAGMIAQGAAPFDAARAAVAAHASAGEMARTERGRGGVLAGEVADLLPRAIEAFR